MYCQMEVGNKSGQGAGQEMWMKSETWKQSKPKLWLQSAFLRCPHREPFFWAMIWIPDKLELTSVLAVDMMIKYFRVWIRFKIQLCRRFRTQQILNNSTWYGAFHYKGWKLFRKQVFTSQIISLKTKEWTWSGLLQENRKLARGISTVDVSK